MYRKMGARRRAAFLRALEATGNQTIAAEAAKVSRSWVVKARGADAAFDAAVRTGIAAAKARLRGARGCRPPTGWGHLDGAQLVVRGTGGSGGGKRVQIARARLSDWTPRLEDRFLAALAATCNVKAALAEVGMSKGSAYTHRKRWPAFALRWQRAVEDGYLAIEAALLAAGCNPFSSGQQPEPEPIPAMSVDQALHLLHMHKHQVHGLGKAPGLPKGPKPFAAVEAGIRRKVEMIVATRGLSDAARRKALARFAARRRP